MNEVYAVSADVNSMKQQIELMASEGNGIVICDNQSYSYAGEFLKRIKQVQKQVDDTRKGMTRPMDEAKKKVMELFKPIESRINDMEASVKTSLLQYQTIVDRRIREELEEKRKKDEAEAAELAQDAEFFGSNSVEMEQTEVKDQMQNVAPTVSGITTKMVWDFEIVDEALLPREMLSADIKKIRAGVEFGMRDVAGLRIFQKQVISSRRS